MIRIFSILVGLAFVFALILGLGSSLLTPSTPERVDQVWHIEPKEVGFASDGAFGKFDERSVQRGFQVFKEVCSACHSIKRVAFRDLQEIGYSEGQVKAIAAGWQIEQPTVNDETGEAATRPNLPSDHFPLVYANDSAARAAQNNAVPPDLSLIAKAREGGPRYIYSLLTGYGPIPPELTKEFPDFNTPAGLHFNRYFPNLNLAMTPPLTSEGQVGYLDGTRATVPQMAHDVASFLVWTAEPKLQVRHQVGWAALLFIAIFTVLAYGAYRNIWRDIKH